MLITFHTFSNVPVYLSDRSHPSVTDMQAGYCHGQPVEILLSFHPFMSINCQFSFYFCLSIEIVPLEEKVTCIYLFL